MTEQPAPRGADLRARRRLFIEGLGFRVFLALVFALALTVLAFGHFVSRANALTAALILFGLAALNGVYWVVGRRAGFPTRQFVVHWAIDIVAVTVVLHFLGGVDTPYGALVYCGLVAFAALNVSRKVALQLATFSCIAFATLVAAEATSVVSPATGMWLHHYSGTAQAASIIAAVVFVYALAWVGGTLADQLRAANAGLRASASRIEEQNRTLEARVEARTLELARATQEVHELVHVVTHDLKNVAVGATETARKLVRALEGGAPGVARQCAGDVLEDTRTLTRMLEDLLALFRESDTSTGSPEWVDVEALVRAVLRRLARQIEERAIEVEIGPLPSVFADPGKVRHVFDNLLDNACKYVGEAVPARIEIGGVREGEIVTYFVRDNGIGIEERQLERIFHLYHRAPRQTVRGEVQRGHGVGLAIVKRIVERAGGRIRVESRPGEGAIFFVAMPRGSEAGNGRD